MADQLQGKVAIVTGASRGIGEAIARRFAAEGARVVLASRKADGLERVRAAIEGAGGEAMAKPCHTGKPDEVDALVAAAVERFGAVDVLVNNAATNPYFGPLMNVEWAAWEKTFEVNLKGYFSATRAVAQHLLDRKAGGAIVNIASVLGRMAAPLQGVYGMTKAGVISMTQTFATELGGAGIRVNAIAPGLIETRFAGTLLANKEITQGVVDRTAIGRVGQPDDISGAALLLASDGGAYITGQTIVIDGGWTVT